jgi:sulfur-carrier protein adenylyltransferase/sulfurtransferase
MSSDLSKNEINRYSRHILIPEVGLEGQRKLKAASVLLVGSGGLGSPAALYLAAAGVGHIGIADYDVVDATNLQRQILHSSATVGRLKTESARERLMDLNPLIQVDTYNEIFSSSNAYRIASEYDMIIDGTDNFPTRYLINDFCALTGKPYIYGSIFRFEGQVSVFDARTGPCYRCLFPEPPPPYSVPSCAQSGVFGVLPGTIGTIQASEAIKIILGIGTSLVGRLLLYDALDMSFQTISLHKNPHCKLCGPKAEIHELIDYEGFCGAPVKNTNGGSAGNGLDVEPRQLAEMLAGGEKLHLLDVREPNEQQISNIHGSVLIPFGGLANHLPDWNHDDKIVVFCRSGGRSTQALQILAASGFNHVKNLHGGINAWVREIDPAQPLY